MEETNEVDSSLTDFFSPPLQSDVESNAYITLLNRCSKLRTLVLRSCGQILDEVRGNGSETSFLGDC